MKSKLNALLLSILLTAGCSKDDSTGLAPVPQFDGLDLIQMDLNNAGADSSNSANSEKAFKDSLSTIDQEIDQLREQNLFLQVSLRDKNTSITQLEKQRRAQYDAEIKQRIAARKPYDLDNSGDVTKEEVRNKLKTDLQYQKDFSDLETAIKNKKELEQKIKLLKEENAKLNYWTLLTTNRREEINSQILDLELKLESVESTRIYHERKTKNLVNTTFDQLYSDQLTNPSTENNISVHKFSRIEKQKQISQNQRKIKELLQKRAQILAQNKVTETPQSSELEKEFLRQKQAIQEKLSKKEKVTIHEILEALVLKNLIAKKVEIANHNDFINDLKTLSQESTSSSIQDFKVTYEKQLADKNHSGSPLIYNKSAITLAEPIYENRIQCYSGTTLFLTLNELQAKAYKNTVVIMTSGHILPGFISRAAVGHLHLNGIETTASGKAIIDYGKTKSIEGDIRVFDAHQFLLVELLKEDLKNFEATYQSMLATIANYEFDTKKLKPIDTSSMNHSDRVLNSSPLAFGYAQVPDGDIQRESFEQKQELAFQRIEGNSPQGGGIESEINAPLCESLLQSEEMFRTQFCLDKGRLVPAIEFLQKNDPESVRFLKPDSYEYSFDYIDEHGKTLTFQTGLVANKKTICSFTENGKLDISIPNQKIEGANGTHLRFSINKDKPILKIERQNLALDKRVNSENENTDTFLVDDYYHSEPISLIPLQIEKEKTDYYQSAYEKIDNCSAQLAYSINKNIQIKINCPSFLGSKTELKVSNFKIQVGCAQRKLPYGILQQFNEKTY